MAEERTLLTAEDGQTVWELLDVQEYDSRMAGIGRSLLNGMRPGLSQVPMLVQSLQRRGRGKLASRALAALAARYVDADELPAENRIALVGGLEGALKDKLGEPRGDTLGRWGVAGAMIGWIVTAFLFNGDNGLSLAGSAFLFLLTTCLFSMLAGAIIEPMAARQVAMVRGQAARSLAAIGEKSSLGLLLAASKEGAGSMSYYLGPHLVHALKELLPRFTEEDYGHVPAEVQANLCDLLNHKDIGLALAALDMLRACGTGSAVTSVTTIRSWGRSLAVRERAAEVLPVLQERLEREREQRRLLRPTMAPLDEEALLRAARGVGEEEGSLLRTVEEGRP